jgi:hypothetical protein
MLRSILGVLVGCFAGGIIAFLLEIPAMWIHPLPAGFNMSDAEALKSHAAKAPLAALSCVAIGWTAAPLVASFVAGVITRRAFLVHGSIVGLIFLVLNMVNVFSFPHPLWLIAIGIVGPLVASYVGASLAARRCSTSRAAPQPYDMREKNMAC